MLLQIIIVKSVKKIGSIYDDNGDRFSYDEFYYDEFVFDTLYKFPNIFKQDINSNECDIFP